MTPKKDPNWRMMEGNKREPWGAELYLRIMGWCGVDVELETACFASDPSDKRMGGSPDRIVIDKKTGERWLLEIKTCPGEFHFLLRFFARRCADISSFVRHVMV